jgi:hypothetical protein
MTRVLIRLVSAIGALLVIQVSARAAPPRLTIALDKSPQSAMLQRELTRDWSKANPGLKLTREQQFELHNAAAELAGIQSKIHERVKLEFVNDYVGVPAPAFRLNRGRWQTIDRKAFAYETMPLRSMWWYIEMTTIAVDPKDREPCVYYYSRFGWSGEDSDVPVAPWDPEEPKRPKSETPALTAFEPSDQR